MKSATIRFIAVGITLASLTACAPTPTPTAVGQPSSSDINPITGIRGGKN